VDQQPVTPAPLTWWQTILKTLITPKWVFAESLALIVLLLVVFGFIDADTTWKALLALFGLMGVVQ
jgi:hypothetical protein